MAADLARQLGVGGFPSIVFITGKAKAVHGIGGYEPTDRFLADMQRALQRAK